MISYRELAENIYKRETFIANYFYEETPNYPHKFHILLLSDDIQMEEAFETVAHDLHEFHVPVEHINISAWTNVDIFLEYILKKQRNELFIDRK